MKTMHGDMIVLEIQQSTNEDIEGNSEGNYESNSGGLNWEEGHQIHASGVHYKYIISCKCLDK